MPFLHNRRASFSPPEQLELRLLPTVKVNFNPNSGLLKFTGDDDINRIKLQNQFHNPLMRGTLSRIPYWRTSTTGL